MTEDTQVPARYETTRKVTTFARKHPVLTVVGLGGAALIGGMELAAGVVIGAGLNTLLRRPNSHEMTHEATSHEAPSHEAAASEPAPHEEATREKSRRMMSRAPHVIRERARAVVDAARGRHPAAEAHGEPHNVERTRTEQPATD